MHAGPHKDVLAWGSMEVGNYYMIHFSADQL